jgi:hypothetical protein
VGQNKPPKWAKPSCQTQQGKIQENIESITMKALPELTEDAKPDAVENDWITHFFDKCRLVSNPEMQSLWAKVLAGEANSPGAFSRRTVDVVSTLDKRDDAISFTVLCGYAWDAFGLRPVIWNDFQNPIYLGNGLNFESMNQ